MKILITGASRGLGFAIARHLSDNHDVVGCGRSEIEGFDHSFKYIPGVDIAHLETAGRDFFSSLQEANVLINNAGVGFDGLLATQPINSIREVLDTNLLGPILLSREFARSMLRRQASGSIINISSIISKRGFKGLSVYSASKGGLDSFTRSLARELGPAGIRVNSVLPGYFASDMSASLGAERMEQILRRTPLSRLAQTEDVVNAVAFLISEQASFITGQTIVIDGGGIT